METTNPVYPFRSMLNALHPLWMTLNDSQFEWVDRLIRAKDSEVFRYAWYIEDLYRQFVETLSVFVEAEE